MDRTCRLNRVNAFNLVGQKLAQYNNLYITHYIITSIGKKTDASAYVA